jgi:DNA-binding HxlR family transcriptional regulator
MKKLAISSDTDLSSEENRILCGIVRTVLDKVADKWAIMILTVLSTQPARFNQIKRRLEGITHKTLAEALKRLERNGLVTRTVLPTTPIGVEYAITPLGVSLQVPFEALYAWAIDHAGDLEEAHTNYERRQAEA